MDLDSGKHLLANNADHLLHPGKFLRHGQYLLGDVLRSEGIVATCRAVRLEQNQPVVIKSLGAAAIAQSSLNALFLADAQRVTQCQHPGLVKILDSFEEAGVAYVVMEFVPGQNLEDGLQSHGPLPESQALQYIRQVASALQSLHRQGLQHLNVCPRSLVRPPTADFVVLTDCGFAQAEIARAELATASQPLVDYRALELNRPNAPITPATDIYALAASLYHLVTGQPPLAAPLRSRSPLILPRQLQPQLSPLIETAILQGLHIDALARPQKLADWLALLQTPPVISTAATTVSGTGSAVTQPPREGAGSKPQPAPSVDLPRSTVPAPTPTPLDLVPPGAALLTPSLPQPIAEPTAPRLPADDQTSPDKHNLGDRSASPFSFPLPQTLMKIAMLASLVGVVGGLVLRFSGGTGPGSEFFHPEQAFPTLSDWQSAAPPAAPPAAAARPSEVPNRPARTAPAKRRQPIVRTTNPVPTNSSMPRVENQERTVPPANSADSPAPNGAPDKPQSDTAPSAPPAAAPPIVDPPSSPISAPPAIPAPVPAPVPPSTQELEPAPVN